MSSFVFHLKIKYLYIHCHYNLPVEKPDVIHNTGLILAIRIIKYFKMDFIETITITERFAAFKKTMPHHTLNIH